mmetsp:Transcript_2406/g.3067  ORF Transcript_2406/g.3067 Transcript_2406/m.3067 type:complete len:81 (+) Transcript_2406:2960-3202(+)
MVVDREGHKKHQERLFNTIGRYPASYVHLENFANYSQVKKDATIADYMEEMNRPCEFHEFMAIIAEHMKEEAQRPEKKLA